MRKGVASAPLPTLHIFAKKVHSMAYTFEPAIAGFVQAVKGKFTKNHTAMAQHIEEQMELFDAEVRGGGDFTDTMSDILLVINQTTTSINELDSTFAKDTELQAKIDEANTAFAAIDTQFLGVLQSSPTKAELTAAVEAMAADLTTQIDSELGDMRAKMGGVFTEMTYGITAHPASDYIEFPNRWAMAHYHFFKVKDDPIIDRVVVAKDEWVGGITAIPNATTLSRGQECRVMTSLAFEKKDLVMFFELHTTDGRVLKLRHAVDVNPVVTNVYVEAAKTNYREFEKITLRAIDGADISNVWVADTVGNRFLNGPEKVVEGKVIDEMPGAVNHKILCWMTRPDGDIYFQVIVTLDQTREGRDFFEYTPTELLKGEQFALIPRREVAELLITSAEGANRLAGVTIEGKSVSIYMASTTGNSVTVNFKARRNVGDEWVAYTMTMVHNPNAAVADWKSLDIVPLQAIAGFWEFVPIDLNLKATPVAKMNVPIDYSKANYQDGAALIIDMANMGIPPWDVEAIMAAHRQGGFLMRASGSSLHRWSTLRENEPDHQNVNDIHITPFENGTNYWIAHNNASSTMWNTYEWPYSVEPLVRGQEMAHVVAVRRAILS